MIVDLETALAELRAGRVVAYPTETVYGLAVDVRSAPALERLRALKGRDAEKGVSVLVPDADALDALTGLAAARRLARAFWPGPLTLVVPVEDPGLVAISTPDGVGLRCSPHPVAAALSRALPNALASTSANRAGEPPARDAAGVEEVFGPGLAIAGGEPAGGQPPSTVVALSADGALRILREGPVSRDGLLGALVSGPR